MTTSSTSPLAETAIAALSASDAPAALRAVDAILSEVTPLAAARTALHELESALEALPIASTALLETVVAHAVDALRPRIAAFEDVDLRLRTLLYHVYWGSADFFRAGEVLALARVDSSTAILSDSERAHAYVRVAQAYLAADDDVGAERYIQRASEWVHRVGVPWGISVQYKVCWARVLDAKRRFLEAALRYVEIARLPAEQLEASELLTMLESAARCIVLAPAGPPRARVMANLIRDERITEIDGRTLLMLQNMCNERLISAADAASFETTLAVHQRAVGADGATVFGRAVVEHNFLAAARIYKNCTFASLGALLGVDPVKAERIAARMVLEKRLVASIDQVDGVLDFATQQGGRGGGAVPVAGGGAADAETLLAWDGATKDVCLGVNTVYERVAEAVKCAVVAPAII